MSLLLYEIKDREIMYKDDITLEEDKIYIIIEKRTKKSTIWIWSGSSANKLDKYYAGVSATKIKSKEKLYGASIEIVESGDEPKDFPKLTKEKLIAPIEKEKALLIDKDKKPGLITEEMVEFESTPHEPQVKSKIKTASIEISQLKILETAEKADLIPKQKVKSLLEGISRTIDTLQNKINQFLIDLENN